MTSGGRRPAPEPYSPRRRSALVFVGTGTAGAYHAGAWRALHEAGLKIDVVAGRGMGAVSALFTAIDAGGRLSSEDGLWRSPAAGRLYPWHPVVRCVYVGGAAAAAIFLAPLLLAAAGIAVMAADFAATLVGLSDGALVRGFSRLAAGAMSPSMLPTWLPRLAVVALAVPALIGVGSALARSRSWRHRVPWWRRLVPPLLTTSAVVDRCWTACWDVLRGASDLRRPPARDLGQRCAELLIENLGQPGFCELLIGAHDLDSRRDVVFGAVAAPQRAALAGRNDAEADSRRGEIVDLASHSRRHLSDAVAAALAVPVVTDPHAVTFDAESFWRGETHRLCDRPGVVHRLVSELWYLGVEQIVLVSSVAEVAAPHALASPRLDAKGRIGEYIEASEAASVRDVIRTAASMRRPLFVIRPGHNPVGPFDFHGGFDDRSNRVQPVSELMAQGYEDAHLQFVEPVLAPSGDRVG